MNHLISAGHRQTHPAQQLIRIFCLIRKVTSLNADVFHFYVVDLSVRDSLIKLLVSYHISGCPSRMPVQAQSQGSVDEIRRSADGKMVADMFRCPYIDQGDIDEGFDIPKGGFDDDLFSIRGNGIQGRQFAFSPLLIRKVGDQEPEIIQTVRRFRGFLIYLHEALKGLNGQSLALGCFLKRIFQLQKPARTWNNKLIFKCSRSNQPISLRGRT